MKSDNMLELVISPYRRKVKTERILPSRSTDIFRVYRVLQELPNGENVDVFLPMTKVVGTGNTRKMISVQVCQLFCVGLEFALERYIRWLDAVALAKADGTPPILHIGIQPVQLANQDIDEKAPKTKEPAVIQTHMDNEHLYTHSMWLDIPISFADRQTDWRIF